MSEYRFGLHPGEASEYLFGLHCGHLSAVSDQIAGRHGAWHVNYTDPRGDRRGWFACPNRGAAFDLAVAKAMMADIERAGGIEGCAATRAMPTMAFMRALDYRKELIPTPRLGCNRLVIRSIYKP